MDLEKTLSQLGFASEDYTISGSDFSMVQKTEIRVKTPAIYDGQGELVSEVEMEEVDVTPAKPTMEQLVAADEELQLMEFDIAMLISAYIEGKERDIENDSMNIVKGLLHSFDFTHIIKPTNSELLALAPSVQAKKTQDEINKEADEYLKSTDWYVLRSLDGIAMPEGMKEERQAARARIVR